VSRPTLKYLVLQVSAKKPKPVLEPSASATAPRVPTVVTTSSAII